MRSEIKAFVDMQQKDKVHTCACKSCSCTSKVAELEQQSSLGMGLS
ncbi:hypothetical protein SCARD494_04357 [Seiridium cardinale]